MTSSIELMEQNVIFSKYPQSMNEYFEKTVVTIKTIPVEFSNVNEIEFPEIHITTADQYIDYLDQEILFWQKNDPNNILSIISKNSLLSTAKTQFNTALNYYKSNNVQNGVNYLKQSIATLRTGALYSKTKLAKYILRYIGRNANIVNGFKAGLSNNQNESVGNSAANLEGFFDALSYREILKESIALSQESIETISESVALANKNYADLNLTYQKAFEDQKKQIAAIQTQTTQKLKELNEESAQHLQDTDKRFNDLETDYKKRFEALEEAYKEHLKLEASAQYWETTDKDYTKKGRLWLGISISFAAIIVCGLIAILIHMPNVFSEETHWFDILKNSTIITVITSISIYLLRIFVKISMSSFHLARDAKERNKLCFLFLALIRDGAVTDKERSIVLTALFSRSDTGLLTGDSGPTMPSGVIELLEAIKKK